MGIAILDAGCSIQCPHGGKATAVPGQTRVKAGGNFVLLASDTMIISGCPFNVAGVPMPCLTIQWMAPATKVMAGSAVLLQSSVGLCKNAAGAPQGTALVSGPQTKATGL
jgi:hypothetical protein